MLRVVVCITSLGDILTHRVWFHVAPRFKKMWEHGLWHLKTRLRARHLLSRTLSICLELLSARRFDWCIVQAWLGFGSGRFRYLDTYPSWKTVPVSGLLCELPSQIVVQLLHRSILRWTHHHVCVFLIATVPARTTNCVTAAQFSGYAPSHGELEDGARTRLAQNDPSGCPVLTLWGCGRYFLLVPKKLQKTVAGVGGGRISGGQSLQWYVMWILIPWGIID